MLRLEDLRPNPGRSRSKKRVGRGNASSGTYSGRGMKGQRSRAGFKMPPGFEGGQTPLWKRVPKRGFTNPHRKEYACINLDVLAENFSKGGKVTPEILIEKGLISNLKDGLKILGRGEIDQSFEIEAHRASQSAIDKVNAAGGSISLLEPVTVDEEAPVQEEDSGSEDSGDAETDE